jgi:hypothetical protein
MLLLSPVTPNDCHISFVIPLNRMRKMFADSHDGAMSCGLHSLIVV